MVRILAKRDANHNTTVVKFLNADKLPNWATDPKRDWYNCLILHEHGEGTTFPEGMLRIGPPLFVARVRLVLFVQNLGHVDTSLKMSITGII